MKKNIIGKFLAVSLLICSFLITELSAQNVAVTDNESYSANASAMLDVYSTTKGMLIPRLTTMAKDTMHTPAIGLIVFDTGHNSFFYYTSSGWVKIPQVNSSGATGSALFAVVNAAGDTIFAVYNDGVKVTVPPGSKGSVGGFAVSGRTQTKGIVETEYFRVTPDSTRIYINDTSAHKGSVGGFAVSGRTQTKAGEFDYLRVTPDSTRVYVNEDSTKGSVGGFAVSGRTLTKAGTKNYFLSTEDSTRVFIPEGGVKGSVGGFAVSGRTLTKGTIADYLNISGNTQATIVKNERRIMWYPVKSAFMAGEVHVGSADSVGTNSTALGYRSIAMGNYSQAMGFQAQSLGLNSTAIGNNAIAKSTNSFAFGDGAQATYMNAYAFGRGAIANGYGSYAFGSAGVDSSGIATGYTYANGDFAFAIGQGAQSLKKGAISLGTQAITNGEFGLSLGYKTEAQQNYTTAVGYRAIAAGTLSCAIGVYSTAMGNNSVSIGGGYASGNSSMAMLGSESSGQGAFSVGYRSGYFQGLLWRPLQFTKATGDYSIAIGNGVIAEAYCSLVLGRQNITSTSYSKTTWVASDPLFVIGNGDGGTFPFANQSNALTILKNGNTGIGTAAPSQKLELGGTSSKIYLNSGTSNMILFNTSGVGAPTYTNRSAGTKLVLYPGVTSTKADYALGIEDYTLWFSVPSNTDRFKFYAGTTEIMRIQGDGKVGIGTTAPTHTLDVRGPVRIVNDSYYYDVWIQGGSATGGEERNLAIVGASENNGDRLYINYGGEYVGGTQISGSLNFPDPFNHSVTSPRYLYVTSSGEVGGINASSIRYKENVYNLDNYEWLYSLRPVIYNYKNSVPSDVQYGLIAEEVDLVNKLLVAYKDNQPEGVLYEKLTIPMLKAIQDQQKIIQNQQSEIDLLKNRINQIEKLLEKK